MTSGGNCTFGELNIELLLLAAVPLVLAGVGAGEELPLPELLFVALGLPFK